MPVVLAEPDFEPWRAARPARNHDIGNVYRLSRMPAIEKASIQETPIGKRKQSGLMPIRAIWAAR